MEKNRPSQHKQTSRKGKKAWIKNIDLDDLQKGLEQNRDNLIKFGKELSNLESDNLFVVDTQGDVDVSKRVIKPLKSTEILNKRSKVTALDHYHHKAPSKVSKKDYKYLMAVSGRDKLESAKKASIDKHGLVTTKAYDVWSLDDEEEEEKSKPEILKKFSSTEWTKPKKAPKTLKIESLAVEQISSIPDAGRSYNPSLDSWKSLIIREYTSEKERDDARIELEIQLEKLQNIIRNTDPNFEQEVDDEDDDEDDDDDEVTEADGEKDFRLSLNKPVVIKKKTKTQKNKQKRHQERIKLEGEVKELKAKIAQLQQIDKLTQEITVPTKKHATTVETIQKRKKLGTKHQVHNQNLDIKLSDELSDSLRHLKPEGNLLQDAMFGLQSKGKIEARIPVTKKRRYKQKITEKWTYKDFK